VMNKNLLFEGWGESLKRGLSMEGMELGGNVLYRDWNFSKRSDENSCWEKE